MRPKTANTARIIFRPEVEAFERLLRRAASRYNARRVAAFLAAHQCGKRILLLLPSGRSFPFAAAERARRRGSLLKQFVECG